MTIICVCKEFVLFFVLNYILFLIEIMHVIFPSSAMLTHSGPDNGLGLLPEFVPHF